MQPNMKGLKGLLFEATTLLFLQTQALRIRFSMILSAVSVLEMLINYSKNTIEITAEFITSTISVFIITRTQTYTFPNCDQLGNRSSVTQLPLQ